MGDAGGQKTDAGQLLVADDLLGPLLDLVVQIVADRAKAKRHVVHRRCEFRHFIVRLEPQLVIEIASGHLPRAANQHVQRSENPAVKELHKEDKEQRRHRAGDPQPNEHEVVLPADFGCKTVERRVQVRGQVDGHDLQSDQLALEVVERRVLVHPGVTAADAADFVQRAFDPLDRLPLRLLVADAAGRFMLLLDETGIVGQRLFHGMKLLDELPARLLNASRNRFRRGIRRAASKAANVCERDAHVGHAGTQFRSQRQLADAPGERLHQRAIGVGRVEAAAGEDGHHRQQQPQADKQLCAEGPLYQHGVSKNPSMKQTPSRVIYSRQRLTVVFIILSV